MILPDSPAGYGAACSHVKFAGAVTVGHAYSTTMLGCHVKPAIRSTTSSIKYSGHAVAVALLQVLVLHALRAVLVTRPGEVDGDYR